LTTELQNHRSGQIILNLSWLLLFAGVVDISIGSISISWLAIRCNLLLIGFAFFLKWFKSRLGGMQAKLLFLFWVLVTIQCYGLIRNFNSYAVMTILLTGLLCIYLCYTIDVDYTNLNTTVFHIAYFILYIAILLDLLLFDGVMLDKYFVSVNTTGGMLVFLNCINVVLHYLTQNNRKNKSTVFVYFTTILLMPLLLFTRARTSVLTILLIVAAFFFLSKCKLKRRTVIALFWIIVFSSITVMYLYSNIDTYAGYSEWNAFSVQLFGKNIDSNRPWLWRESLRAMENYWILGVGTGTITSDVIYYEGSFHNQFLQLFIQNGLIGLGILYSILFVLWRPMSNHLDDRVVRFCVATFIGIIAYNCFETTLLQNKMALGLMEWQLIAIGVSRAKKLELLAIKTTTGKINSVCGRES